MKHLLLAGAGFLSGVAMLLFSPATGAAHTAVSGCIEGKGGLRQEARALPAFDAIQVDGAFDVSVVVGPARQEVVVASDANLLPYLVTEVRGKVLFISTRRSVCPREKMEVRLQCRSLRSLISRGTNEIDCSGIDSAQLRLEIVGAGNATVAGRAGRLVARVLGSSELQAEALSAGDVDVAADGASSATVKATRSLRAASGGVSQVIYSGNPRLDGENITGMGEIIKR